VTGAGPGSRLACSVLTAAGFHSSRAAGEIGSRTNSEERLSTHSSSRVVASAAKGCAMGGAAEVCFPRAAAAAAAGAGNSLLGASGLEEGRFARVVSRAEEVYWCCCTAAVAEGESAALEVSVSGRRGELGRSNCSSFRGLAIQPQYDQNISGRHTLSGSANLHFGQPNSHLEVVQIWVVEGERRTQAGHLG
jgi:hypothetical protein